MLLRSKTLAINILTSFIHNDFTSSLTSIHIQHAAAAARAPPPELVTTTQGSARAGPTSSWRQTPGRERSLREFPVAQANPSSLTVPAASVCPTSMGSQAVKAAENVGAIPRVPRLFSVMRVDSVRVKTLFKALNAMYAKMVSMALGPRDARKFISFGFLLNSLGIP